MLSEGPCCEVGLLRAGTGLRVFYNARLSRSLVSVSLLLTHDVAQMFYSSCQVEQQSTEMKRPAGPERLGNGLVTSY